MGELGRRVVHGSGVVIPGMYLVGIVTWQQLQALVAVGLLIAVILETLRLHRGLEWWIYEHLTRPYEQETIAGYGLYMFSVALVTVLFEPPIAVPAMLMLMIGDPISGYLSSDGSRRVKRPLPIIAMVAVCTLLTLPFALDFTDDTRWAFGIALAAALAGTAADAVKWSIGSYIVDDNLTIPIVAAVALWIGSRFVVPAL